MPDVRATRSMFAGLVLALTACQPVNINVGDVRGVDARGATVGDVNANANVNASVDANIEAKATVNTGAATPASATSSPTTSPSVSPQVSPDVEVYPPGVKTRLTVVAGTGTSGMKNDVALSSMFASPGAIVFDGSGNLLVADTGNRAVRKIRPDGTVETLIEQPAISSVGGLAIDAKGTLLVGDPDALRVWRRETNGTMDKYVEGVHLVEGLNDRAREIRPNHITLDHRQVVYVHTPENQVLAFGANGERYQSGFVTVGGVAFFDDGTAIATISAEHRLVKLSGNQYTSFVGGSIDYKSGLRDDRGLGAKFNNPTLLTRDRKGNLFVYDAGNLAIRKVTASGEVTTIFKEEDGGNSVKIGDPGGLAVDTKGIVHFSDRKNHRILRVE